MSLCADTQNFESSRNRFYEAQTAYDRERTAIEAEDMTPSEKAHANLISSIESEERELAAKRYRAYLAARSTAPKGGAMLALGQTAQSYHWLPIEEINESDGLLSTVGAGSGSQTEQGSSGLLTSA